MRSRFPVLGCRGWLWLRRRSWVELDAEPEITRSCMTFTRGAPVSVFHLMDELNVMLLKAWEKHEHMSTKGEK
jgi:hypothetical protein